MDEGNKNDGGEPVSTAFDALVEKMKRDLDAQEAPGAGAAHVSHLRSVFDAALNEFGAPGRKVGERLHGEGEKLQAQMKAHPVATVSSAFAAGYFVGKAIAGRARK